MPVLILLGIAAVFGIASIREKSEPPTNYPFNGTDQQKADWICRQNQKRIEKIMRKHRK